MSNQKVYEFTTDQFTGGILAAGTIYGTNLVIVSHESGLLGNYKIDSLSLSSSIIIRVAYSAP